MKKKEKTTHGGLIKRETFDPTRQEFWPWNPFRDFSIIRNTMNEMFGDLFKGHSFGIEGWQPPINMYEKNGNLIIEVYLPGVPKEHLNINSTPDALTLSGEYSKESETKDKNYYYKEMRHNKFSRTIGLPCEVRPDEIKANFKDGKLTITLPVTEPSRLKEVKVNIE